MLFSLAEMKIIQINHGVFKSFAINQSESSITYKENFIFSDIKQSESSFNVHEIFKKFNVNQSELSSFSHGIFNTFDIKQSELSIFLVTLFVGNQPIRIQRFLKVNCLSFFKSFNHHLEKNFQKRLNFLSYCTRKLKFHSIFSLMK